MKERLFKNPWTFGYWLLFGPHMYAQKRALVQQTWPGHSSANENACSSQTQLRFKSRFLAGSQRLGLPRTSALPPLPVQPFPALRRSLMCSTIPIISCRTAEHNGVMQANGGTHDGASDSSAGKGSRQVKGSALILKQFHALLVKRFHHAVRSQKDFVAQVRRRTGGGSVCFASAFTPFLLTSILTWISDRPSCQFCPHCSDLHRDRPSVWRVPQSDSDPLDVRTTAHLLQVSSFTPFTIVR